MPFTHHIHCIRAIKFSLGLPYRVVARRDILAARLLGTTVLQHYFLFNKGRQK